MERIVPMTIFEPFDLVNTSLEGRSIIEASAGTGKTHAIAGLFLRLILEKDLSVGEILVVTFTEAATEELRRRIRSMLVEAEGTFSGRRPENRLIRHIIETQDDQARAQDCLRAALRDFDQAAIFTIHGFCRRMLHENAFESGSLFDTELLTDDSGIKREVIEDFWRRELYGATPLFVNYALSRKFMPDGLLELVGSRTGQPYIKVIPEPEIPNTDTLESAFQACSDNLRQAWVSTRAEVEDILTRDPGLNRSRYRGSSIRRWVREMDHWMAWQGSNPELFNNFARFTSSELLRSVRTGHGPPAHPFFDLCEEVMGKSQTLTAAFDRRLLGMKTALFQFVQTETSRRKRERNTQSFDDLLINLHGALENRGGKGLIRTIRRRFNAALIDEFQDTDPIQYGIFNRIFEDENTVLVLIGDPKQAIYGFRGADVFAYLKASRHLKSRYTLGENWRSEPDLITAVNTIFGQVVRPFYYDEIPFQPAEVPAREEREVLTIDGVGEPPMQLWFLPADRVAGAGKAVTKMVAQAFIPEAVTAEILRLLRLGREQRALLGQKPLEAGDIAVLVRTNAEARQMQKALVAAKIRSVLYGMGNLFDSHEAFQMERILAALVEPRQERLIKAALATDMMGVGGERLEDIPENEQTIDRWLIESGEYHDQWNRRGFLPMFRHLMARRSVLPRLMNLPDGERRCTNVLHLAEVLHHVSIEKRIGMAGLLKWISEQRDTKTPRVEEHQLRLESDGNAVKVVTIHKSKGLQYPVVFCPFSWYGSRIKDLDAPVMFHDQNDDMRRTLDLGSEDLDSHRGVAEKELLAESLRLFYVALTRARNRCYLVWGRFKDGETSAPAYLLPRSGLEPFENLRDDDMRRELKILEDRARGTIQVSEMSLKGGGEYAALPIDRVDLICRDFSGNIDRQWKISSFSSLIALFEHPHLVEIADRDPLSPRGGRDRAGSEGSGVDEGGTGIFSFPRGTRAGTLLHDIFEHLDFAQEDPSGIKKLVVSKLTDYGFDVSWQEVLCDMASRVLSVPLDGDRGDFTLSRIGKKDRLSEVEFYFPLKSVSPDILDSVSAGYARRNSQAGFPEFHGRLQFSPVKGFMKGFMDLVFQLEDRFYLVDWKSNWLGNNVEDYGQDALSRVMEEELYTLQYHIYTVALNEYLRLRLVKYDYEIHFGGVYYIFLRGVDPKKGSDYGIYRDRPPVELIGDLCEKLIDRH
jgi:exodeoxyribonuclease V beta subunit